MFITNSMDDQRWTQEGRIISVFGKNFLITSLGWLVPWNKRSLSSYFPIGNSTDSVPRNLNGSCLSLLCLGNSVTLRKCSLWNPDSNSIDLNFNPLAELRILSELRCGRKSKRNWRSEWDYGRVGKRWDDNDTVTSDRDSRSTSDYGVVACYARRGERAIVSGEWNEMNAF